MNSFIQPHERGETMRRWRNLLGWSSVRTAERLSITTRTLNSDEAEGVVPDARWRHFLLEVGEHLRHGTDLDELVCIFADDGFTLIDVVSYSNFAGFVVADDCIRAMVASYTVDRNDKFGLHRQEFILSANQHAHPILKLWEQRRMAEAGGNEEEYWRRWITRRSLATALNRPDIASLKQRAEASRKRLLEAEPNSEEYDTLFEENEAIVAEMIQAISMPQKKR